MGVTAARDAEQLAGNLLRLARLKAGVSQREMSARAGVAQSTIARIESYQQQPSLPVLLRLLAAVDLELRTHLEPYDDHDDVLDAETARLSPAALRRRDAAQDAFVAALRAGATPS